MDMFFNVNMNVYRIISIIIGTGYAKMPVFGKVPSVLRRHVHIFN